MGWFNHQLVTHEHAFFTWNIWYMLSVSGAMFCQSWRGDSGGLMHEEEFEGASESAEEEEVGGGVWNVCSVGQWIFCRVVFRDDVTFLLVFYYPAWKNILYAFFCINSRSWMIDGPQPGWLCVCVCHFMANWHCAGSLESFMSFSWEFEAHSYSEFGGFQEANKSLHRHKPWNPTKSMGLWVGIDR